MPKRPPTISAKVKRTTPAGRKLWSNEGKSTTARGYGWQHQKARARLLAEEPLCRTCQAEGRVTLATIADHIDPMAETGRTGPKELQPLCDTCHAEKTLREARRGKQRALRG